MYNESKKERFTLWMNHYTFNNAEKNIMKITVKRNVSLLKRQLISTADI